MTTEHDGAKPENTDLKGMPWPSPIHATDNHAGNAQIQAEIMAARRDTQEILRVAHSGYSLFHTIMSQKMTPEDYDRVSDAMTALVPHVVDVIAALPYPVGVDHNPGEVYTPYMAVLGLTLMCQAVTQMSPHMHPIDRYAVLGEFVRAFGMHGAAAHAGRLGYKADQMAELAGLQAMMHPFDFVEIMATAKAVRAYQDAEDAKRKAGLDAAQGEVTRPTGFRIEE